MQSFVAMGRLTKEPEVRYGGQNNTAIAKFDIAVNRRFKREGEPDADFFNCVAFGKTAEFVEKYIRKGMKVVITGELRNNNYTNKEGVKVYGMQINVSTVDFCESRKSSEEAFPAADSDGFLDVSNIDDELPFI